MLEFTGYNTLWQAVIRPPRQQYEPSDLGASEFVINNMRITRTDLELKNHQGFTLQCSHFEPHEQDRQWNDLPCVVYLHGNTSCRLESLEAVKILLPLNISLFCFDFSGCGLSEGEYVTLGWFEREDLNLIVEYLRKERRVSTIGLWGRSMGAVTALLYGDRDPSIGGMVLDSPFCDMEKLVSELSKIYTKIPQILVNGTIKFVNSTIKSKAKFDIYDLSPIQYVNKCFIPALFATANQDQFVLPHHSEILFEKYAGDKNIVRFDGNHYTARPKFLYDSAAIFFYNTLQVEHFLKEEPRTQCFSTSSENNFLDHQVDLEVLSDMLAQSHFKKVVTKRKASQEIEEESKGEDDLFEDQHSTDEENDQLFNVSDVCDEDKQDTDDFLNDISNDGIIQQKEEVKESYQSVERLEDIQVKQQKFDS